MNISNCRQLDKN